MPTIADRRNAIFAAVEAYNRANPAAPLPRPVARLLVLMFADQDACRLSQQALAADGFGKALPGLLRALVDADFVSREPGTSRAPDTYLLHLPMPAEVQL
jgi:hypothetical protein